MSIPEKPGKGAIVANRGPLAGVLPTNDSKSMDKLHFKTNINCGNCVRSVTGFLNEVPAIESWSVDTDNPAKILTVVGTSLKAEQVIAAVEEAGFDIELDR
jgi:copper chaperone